MFCYSPSTLLTGRHVAIAAPDMVQKNTPLVNYDKSVATLWTIASNRPGWMHFGQMSIKMARKVPIWAFLVEESQNVRFLEMKPALSRIADFYSFNDERFVFCMVESRKRQKTGRQLCIKVGAQGCPGMSYLLQWWDRGKWIIDMLALQISCYPW